ncbi:MAG: hypothetical protein ACYS17_08610, partial [Planctomycetota bacterium]
PNVQMNLTLFITMNYTISDSLTKVKNKANSNPIKANLESKKTQSKPIQSRFKPKTNQKQNHLSKGQK